MIEKYGTPTAISITGITRSHAPILPSADSLVCAGRLPLPLTSRWLFLPVMKFRISRIAMQIQTRTADRLAERPKSMGAVVE